MRVPDPALMTTNCNMLKNIRINVIIYCRALESHDLFEEDRLILERLALKRFKEAEQQVKSQILKKQWMEERAKWEKGQKAHATLFQNEIQAKRKSEAEMNEAKLNEAREKLIESQKQLQLCIEQKQQRADQLFMEAQK